jgi:hypothetical protein
MARLPESRKVDNRVNILVEQLPTAVEIDGQAYEIHSDFRACLRVILAFEDAELTNLEKQAVLLDNLYPVKPANLQAALAQGVKFLDGGKVESGEEGESSPRLYSFAKDAGFIFAAFKQTHGIDLETAELHWWKFLALFMDLGSETTFCNLVSLRKRVKTGKASKEERKAAREMGDIFDIPDPDTRTPEEKAQEDEFMRLVREGERNRANQS